MQAAIETQALMRRYGSHTAVAGIDLRVPGGSVYGFLGPNGAGKTTTIRMQLGLTRPTAGSICMLGKELPAARRQVAQQVGALVETPAHYDHLTGTENLDITRRLLGLPAAEIERVLEVVDLRSAARERVRGYSLGMRQRLGVARALIGSPRLLILDEPTNGLDPDGIRDMRRLLRSLAEAQDCTVLISSHLLGEVEHIASHVGLMWQGRLVAQGTLAGMLARGATTLELDVDQPDAAVRLLAKRGLTVVRRTPLRLEVQGAVEPATVNSMLTAAGLAVSHLCVRRRSLESFYLDLTRGSEAQETAR